MMVLAKVEQIYKTALQEKDIVTECISSPDQIEKLGKFKEEIKIIVNKKRGELGIENIPPIRLSKEKAQKLRETIKFDKEWIEAYKEMVYFLSPDTNLKDSHKIINLPWWNSGQFGLADEEYDGNKRLKLKSFHSHSYLTQLARSGNFPELGNCNVSLRSVLSTPDKVFVLGYRGGQSFSNTLMTVASGSLEFHSGKNPLFESLWKETKEEMNLEQNEFEYAGLVGRVTEERTPAKAYVFRLKTNIPFNEVLNRWTISKEEDKAEHRYLIPFFYEDHRILEILKEERYDLDIASAPENLGKILQEGVIAILADYSQKFGYDSAKKAEDLFDEDYDLTSCFKK